ncbi:MAG: exodeoxyribonuclease VII small subunit [Oscillospiraceae bacterium]|nr:exodeoxyribonuclease VII small subunit [Oscillospiraceae bacterium]MBR2080541.1 exodeoxyribonuclease VII small subunit [Oscillospiraceae bacterium]MBR2365600.1 exodeoxyribonuclease VII small subunit [Oscillospiraceae bacterium]MBR2896548.1 exodeoxyribonuclease VII small subunit [Oscillospiraceae bacterium]MBR2976916.1 exodeoxyribonuclease VII small subunit [Oscillospiraceae bacterium]
MSKQSQTFEQSMDRLEEIVRKIEQGNVPLEESLKLFEEGTKLVDSCAKLLDKAELKVLEMTKGADGEPAETEWNDNGVS